MPVHRTNEERNSEDLGASPFPKPLDEERKGAEKLETEEKNKSNKKRGFRIKSHSKTARRPKKMKRLRRRMILRIRFLSLQTPCEASDLPYSQSPAEPAHAFVGGHACARTRLAFRA
ncbi:hypothetical protein MTO96_031185 [Rhipicephalus appendiculatus]